MANCSIGSKSKQHSEAEEDTIYDTNDSKSMGSNTIYADDYVPSPASTIKMGKHAKSGEAKSPTRFNERLKRLYYSLNKTLSMSSHIVGRCSADCPPGSR